MNGQRVSPSFFGRFLVLTVALLSVGCGPSLDPLSELSTLRILGMKKSAPYARPGESVDLKLIWEDGRPDPPDDVQTFFGFWCLNPAGDLYSECLFNPPNIPVQFGFDVDEFTIEIPEDSLREDLRDPNFPPYGSAIVFYGACAGQLDLQINASPDDPEQAEGDALLPRCLDEDGEELGPDDFIIGYSTIFIYEELRNENPIVLSFEIDGEEVEVDCIDDECNGQLELPDIEGCTDGIVCIEACEDDGDCSSVDLRAVIDESSAEVDDIARVAFDRDIEESLWVNYFVDSGSVSPEVKLVNDAELGWQEDYTSSFRPAGPGPVRIWATVRDNRGGFAWVRLSGFVQ